MAIKKTGLGKGLGGLFEETGVSDIAKRILDETNKSEILDLALDEIVANPFQPRKKFEEASLKELSDSIQDQGVVTPIIVRKLANHKYEIVAGERRFRASKLAKQKSIPAIVKEFDDNQTLEIAIIENLHRNDLNVIEEAKAYRMLMEKLDLSQQELADKLAKKRSTLTNTLRLLNLPVSVQDKLENNDLQMGHARAILGLANAKQMEEVADIAVEKQLSVREVEKLVQSYANNQEKTNKASKEELPKVYLMIRDDLENKFGTKVQVKPKKNGGKIEFDYSSDEDLNRILSILGVEL